MAISYRVKRVMSGLVLITFVVSCFLASIHLNVRMLKFLRAIPRSRWLSFAGGVSVAFVFVNILPSLSIGQVILQEEAAGITPRRFEKHAYLVALVGLLAFYGVERLVRTFRRRAREKRKGSPAAIYWIRTGSFALYNVIIGYLLLRREIAGFWSLALYSIALGLHFVVNDFGLWLDNRHLYQISGRWILALAILAGWTLSLITSVSDSLVAFLFAFLAGGIIMNVLNEEMPEERESSFWALVLGCATFVIFEFFG